MNITTLLYASVLAAVSVIPIEVADAFVFNRRYTHNSHECLELRMQVDVAGIIKAALSTSNKFGVASYKAIIAWKPIDEIDYDDGISGKAAYKARYDDTLRIEDYETLLDEIKPLLEKQELKTGKMKSLAKEIKVSSLYHCLSSIFLLLLDGEPLYLYTFRVSKIHETGAQQTHCVTQLHLLEGRQKSLEFIQLKA